MPVGTFRSGSKLPPSSCSANKTESMKVKQVRETMKIIHKLNVSLYLIVNLT